jgi:hypothetical protein
VKILIKGVKILKLEVKGVKILKSEVMDVKDHKMQKKLKTLSQANVKRLYRDEK